MHVAILPLCLGVGGVAPGAVDFRCVGVAAVVGGLREVHLRVRIRVCVRMRVRRLAGPALARFVGHRHGRLAEVKPTRLVLLTICMR